MTDATLPTPNQDEDKLDVLIAKYDDWYECDEYHIHDNTDEHEGETPLPHDFDTDQLKAALRTLLVSVRIDELNRALLKARSTQIRLMDAGTAINCVDEYYFKDRLQQLQTKNKKGE